ncbi:MAG: UDP-2,4-diacetamido-2,4,6-trideoxy-beta-L-altropyranose hydrolase [Chloroflexi bacterium]|nr:UDP-2,4-diacetamido-2,4,6-trideoxy-beta-L-altropyranose hydrolase [Chloroflexota bacterium]
MSKLLIRTDANGQTGTGHLMRCLALAQVWQVEGGQAHFALADTTAALVSRLLNEGMIVHHLAAQPAGSPADAAETAALAGDVGAAWVIVDGYYFDAAYQKAIKEAGLCLLFVDDYGHSDHYYADLVLNQNAYADEKLYQTRERHTRLLLGTRYTLLRREFWPWRGWQRETPEVARKVLVTLGGGDPNNVTLNVIRALQQLTVKDLEATVVVGSSNIYLETLQTAVEAWVKTTSLDDRPATVRLMCNVSNMPELMAWADVAIAGSGSTTWELTFMGLPSCLIILADNQEPVARQLHAEGIATNMGWFDKINWTVFGGVINNLMDDVRGRHQMSFRGQVLVDGNGGRRVVHYILERSR